MSIHSQYVVRFEISAGKAVYLCVLQDSMVTYDSVDDATKFYSKAKAYDVWNKYMKMVEAQLYGMYDLDKYIKEYKTSMTLVKVQQTYKRGHYVYC